MSRRTGFALLLAFLALSGALAPLAAPASHSASQNPLDPVGAASAQQSFDSSLGCWVSFYISGAGLLAGEAPCLDGQPQEEELTGADAEETKVNIYSSGATQAQNTDNTLTSIENRLQDARTIARIEGKHAAIRAMNNGSTQIQAEQAAQTAIEDYYATLQINVIASWNTSLAHSEHLHEVAENSSGVSGDYVGVESDLGQGAAHWEARSITLVNGTQRMSYTIAYDTDHSQWAHPASNNGNNAMLGPAVEGVDSDGDSDDNRETIANQTRYQNVWSNIQTDEDSITTEVQTYVGNVHSSYEEGDINNTDLIDPYLGAREYGPDDGFETWAALSLQSIGVNSPDNMSQIGFMEIASGSQVYEGVLLSDGLPQGDAYEVGETYNAAQISGTQAVVTSEEVVEIEGEFTLLNATTSDGETFNESEAITYRNVTYETTNTAEYQDLMEELTETQAEIEARQQQLRSGGGGLFGGAWPFGTIETIIIVGVVIVILTRG